MPRVITVGRLDYFSEGLLLLTNDGGLARKLELPANGWTAPLPRSRPRHCRRGEARGPRQRASPSRACATAPIQASLDRQQRSNAWIDIALTEGKNREVRRVLAHLDLPVVRLIRVAFGPFHLGELERGLVDEIPPQALENLLGVKRPPRKQGWAKPKPKPTPGPRQEPAARMIRIIGGKHRPHARNAAGRCDAARPPTAPGDRCSTF